MSSYLIPTDASIINVLSDIQPTPTVGDQIINEELNTLTWSELDAWQNIDNLPTWPHEEMLVFVVAPAQTFTRTGIPFHSVEVNTGWNYISFARSDEMQLNTNNSMQHTGGFEDGDFIYYFTTVPSLYTSTFNKTLNYFDGTLKIMVPTKGYLLIVENSGTLTFTGPSV